MIQAYDSAIPSQVAEEELTISIDNAAPVIAPPTASIDLSEYHAASVIYTVPATDADDDVLTFTFDNVGDSAKNFFWVNPTTGDIRLMRSLLTVTTNRFIVSIKLYHICKHLN